MPRPLSRKRRILYFSIFVLFFLVAIPVLLLYSSGYSLDTALNLSWRGGIFVSVDQTGASVFIGDSVAGVTSLFNHDIVVKNLRPDNYLVLVSHNDYWPWAKFVQVTRGEVAARYPLLVPKVVPFSEIARASTTEYSVAKALFTKTAASTTVEKAGMKLLVDGNTIRAEWHGSDDALPYYFCVGIVRVPCPRTVPIFQDPQPIRALDFYPGRTDALLITVGNSVYATEIDPTLYRNSYPIFRGKKPEVRINRGSVYIKDGDYILSAPF